MVDCAHFAILIFIMPGDLNLKKLWNPALVKNQAKVWKEEQKSLEEFKKIKEREQELLKEQEDLKLIALKKKSLLLNKHDKLKLNKLDWMYDDPVDVKKVEPKKSAVSLGASKRNNIDTHDPMRKIAKGPIKSTGRSDQLAKNDPLAKYDPMNNIKAGRVSKRR